MPYSCNNEVIILLKGRIIGPSTPFFFSFFFIYVGRHILLTLWNSYTIEKKLSPLGVFTIIFLKNNTLIPNRIQQQIDD